MRYVPEDAANDLGRAEKDFVRRDLKRLRHAERRKLRIGPDKKQQLINMHHVVYGLAAGSYNDLGPKHHWQLTGHKQAATSHTDRQDQTGNCCL